MGVAGCELSGVNMFAVRAENAAAEIGLAPSNDAAFALDVGTEGLRAALVLLGAAKLDALSSGGVRDAPARGGDACVLSEIVLN